MAKKVGTERVVSERKAVLTCGKCGQEFVATIRTRTPRYCELCSKKTTWVVVGEEMTKYGKVIVERNRDGRERRILVE